MKRPTTLAQLIRKQLATLGLTKKVREAGATEHWPAVVGPEIAAHTRVVKIEDGRLFVAVDEPAWRQELLYQRQAIIDKLNRELGGDEPVVNEIMFTGP